MERPGSGLHPRSLHRKMKIPQKGIYRPLPWAIKTPSKFCQEDVHLPVQGHLISHPLNFYTESLCILFSGTHMLLVNEGAFRTGSSAPTAEIGLLKASDRHLPPKSKAKTSALREQLCSHQERLSRPVVNRSFVNLDERLSFSGSRFLDL